jgi:hypothetical protein
MGLKGIRSVVAIACALVLVSTPVFAQQSPDVEALRAEVNRLRQQLEALETRLAAVEGAATAPPPTTTPQIAAPAPTGAQLEAAVPAGAEGAGGPSGSLPVYGGSVAASKVFNPDMAVIGNFLGAAGRNEVTPLPALEMHEAEASFQAVVDPYARADFFLGFGQEGVDLEEGYVTFPTLPGGLLVRAGKMKAAFGKVNTLHSHVLPWTDRPLMVDNLIGGEEGISDSGFSVARLISNPVLFLEATGQVFRGDSGDVVRSSKRGDLTYVGHLRAYQDVTENGNIDFGASYTRGHNAAGLVGDVDLGRFVTSLYGVDATYRWRPLSRSIYHSFIGRTEIVWSRRDQPGGLQNSMGYFASGDYQFGRRWFIGGRYDRSGHADSSETVDTGQSVVLTYWPSEFSQVRSQYRRTKYAVGSTANELLFQLQFSIGAHGAHPF